MRSSALAKSCLALALFLMPATAQTAPQQEYYYAVTGKVIDEHGQPVAGAYVVVDAGPGGDIVLFTEADSQGKFRFEERASLLKEERTMYVKTARQRGLSHSAPAQSVTQQSHRLQPAEDFFPS